jgi:transcription initiation factor TFIIF subunit beta
VLDIARAREHIRPCHQIPKFLMERWSAINAEDHHLATVRVYSNAVNPVTNKPRIVLFLPPNRDPSDTTPVDLQQQPNRPMFAAPTFYKTTGAEPDAYELDMINDSVDNQIVVAERPKDPSLSISTSAAAATVNTRARTTILTGRIKHECNLRPAFSASYRKQMKERHLKYNTPLRQIRMIDDAGVPGGRGGVNRLSSGVGVGAGSAFGDLIVRILVVSWINVDESIENETQTGERHVRAYGSYATEPASRSNLPTISRSSTLGYTAIAG